MKSSLLTVSALLACAGLLVACGGSGGQSAGSGGSSAPTPTPTPTPTPVPTPTPTPTPNPAAPPAGVLVPGPGTEALSAAMLLTVNARQDATSDRSVLPPGTDFTLSYDSQQRRFTTGNGSSSRNWPLSALQDFSVPDLAPRVQFEIADPAESNFLVLFKACNCTPPLLVDSAGFGAWQQNRPLGADTRVRLDYFVYGPPTAAPTLPTSGTFAYRINGSGNMAESGRLFLTAQLGTMSVDFAARTVRISVTIVGNDFLTGTTGGLGLFAFEGTITDNGFEGPITHAPSLTQGRLKGRFFGPEARDMAFVFSGEDFESHFVGAVSGTRF